MKVVHRRLVRSSKPLRDELELLGFEEVSTEGSGLNRITKYKLKDRDKYVFDSYRELVLIDGVDLANVPIKDIHGPNHNANIHHRGLTIHDEMLRFWSSRSPVEFEKPEKGEDS